MKASQVKAGSVLSYVQMAVNVIVGLLYTPIMIKLLGVNEYGLYNTVASTISMLSILNLGFSSGYIRYYSKYRGANDQHSIDKLNGLFLIIFIIIGLVSFACGIFITNHLELVFSSGLTDEEFLVARILMLLFTINMSLSFPSSVFSSIISANERFVFLKLLGIVKTILSPILAIPLLLLGYGSIAIVAVTLIVTIIMDAAHVYYTICVLKNKFVFFGFEVGIFRSLLSYTIFIAINIVVDQINSNVGKILLGRYCGTAAVAVYSVGANLQIYYQMFSTALSGIFAPRIHNTMNASQSSLQEKYNSLSDLFTKVGRIQFLILALICSGFIFFGKGFVYIWAGAGYEDAYYIALLLMIPVTIPLIQNVGIEIQRAQNKHQFRSIAYVGMAIVNFFLTSYLCQAYGAKGAAWGTALSLLLANGIAINIYYHKKCHINIIAFWNRILKLARGVILPVIYGCIVCHFFTFTTVSTLLIGIGTYCILYVMSMWLFGMNAEEKQFVSKMLRKVWRKRG